MASNILKVFIVNSENEEQICDIMDAIIRDPSTIKVSRFSDQGYECLEIERENGTELTYGTTFKADWRCDDLPSIIADQLMANCDVISILSRRFNVMTNLFITIGCSGAGKSTWIKEHSTPGATVISPDEERRKLSSVNDQTVSGRAFVNCYDQLFHLSPRDKCREVYFDATSLKTEYISSIVDAVNPVLKKGLKVALVLFEDSRNPDLCISRIHEDVKNKVDRSNTPDDVVRTMSKRYIELIDSENFDDFCKEHKFEKVIVKSFTEHI